MFSRKRYRNKIKFTGLFLFALCILTLGYANNVQDLNIQGTVEGITTFKLDTVVETGLNSGDLSSVAASNYAVDSYATQYYYRGTNPNNYVIFANKCFRIVSITQNSSVKIIYDGSPSPSGTCETITTSSGLISNTYRYNANSLTLSSGINNWFDTADDSIKLRQTFEDFITSGNVGGILLSNSNINSLADASWYVGAVNKVNQSFDEDLANEKTNQGNTALPSLAEISKDTYEYNGKIGLLNVTDYVRASKSDACISVYSGVGSDSSCGSQNYLAKTYEMVFMNPVSDTTDKIWAVNENGQFIEKLVYDEFYIRPVFYLNPGLNYAGQGTMSNPYIII